MRSLKRDLFDLSLVFFGGFLLGVAFEGYLHLTALVDRLW